MNFFSLLKELGTTTFCIKHINPLLKLRDAGNDVLPIENTETVLYDVIVVGKQNFRNSNWQESRSFNFYFYLDYVYE